MPTLQGTFEDVAGVAVPGVRYTVSTPVPIATADGIRIKPRDLTADSDGHWSIDVVGGHLYTIAVDKRAGVPWGPVTVMVPDGAGPYDVKNLAPVDDPDVVTTFTEWLSAAFAGRLEAASYTYNPDGSVATETVGGATTTYTYNADGSVHTATRNGVTMTYTYDASGNVTAVA